MALLFSSSYNAFIYSLTYTKFTGFKVACNNEKAIAMYFSTTENFLFHFLMVQSSARRWRSSEKPFPPWIPQFNWLNNLKNIISKSRIAGWMNPFYQASQKATDRGVCIYILRG